jgi:hypothetical protein
MKTKVFILTLLDLSTQASEPLTQIRLKYFIKRNRIFNNFLFKLLAI